MENKENPRLAREKKTIQLMIAMYCRDHHHGQDEEVCQECSELEAYAMTRLSRCPFGEEKPTCARCVVHCYKPAMRERVKIVMRFAGPRMMYTHPMYAIRHMLDGRRDDRLQKELKKKGRG